MFNFKIKLVNFLNRILRKNDNKKKFMLGSIYLNEARKRYDKFKNLNEAEYKVFSQTGEDGILDFILNKLQISNTKFVEIGVGDYSEANTRFIYENSFSEGLIIDVIDNFKKKVSDNIDLWKGLINVENVNIDLENINPILKRYNLDKNLDLFSIDIDGNDYWIIDKLSHNISKIFVLEYNPTFGHNLEITVPYNKYFSRFKEHYSGCYYGASLKAMIKIMNSKGFEFLGTNKLNFNAFFVSNKVSNNFSAIINNIHDLSHHTKLHIRDSRNEKGELNYLDQKQRLKTIEDKEVVDVSNSIHKKYKIKDLISSI